MGNKSYHTFKVYLIVTMKIPYHTNLISGPEDAASFYEKFSSVFLGQYFLIGQDGRRNFQIS